MVALAVGGFILWKRRRAQKNRDNAGYLPNNSYDDDDRSFVGGRNESVVGPKFNEKYPSDSEAFNMQDMQSYNDHGYMDMQQTGGYGAAPTAAAVGAYAAYPGEHTQHDPRRSSGYDHVRSSYDGQLYNPDAPHQYAADPYVAYPGSPPMAPVAEGQERYSGTQLPLPFPGLQPGDSVEQQQRDMPTATPMPNGASGEEGPFADPQYVDKMFKVSTKHVLLVQKVTSLTHFWRPGRPHFPTFDAGRVAGQPRRSYQDLSGLRVSPLLSCVFKPTFLTCDCYQ